jgi:hypothetical protein
VFLVDPARPTTLHYVSKWFGFSDSLGWVAQNVLEKSIHSLQGQFVVGLPIGIVLPAEGSKD